MPELSRFFGIVIQMHFNDHPPPHFHAKYGEFKAAIDIATLTVSDGYLPPRAYGLVIEWASIHEDELQHAWNRIREHRSPGKITPLT